MHITCGCRTKTSQGIRVSSNYILLCGSLHLFNIECFASACHQSIMLYPIFALFFLVVVWSTSNVTFVPKGAICQDYTIPLTVTSQNRPWIGPRWTDNYGFIDFLSTAATRQSAGFPSPVDDPINNQTASYTISATFCSPETAGEHSKTVLLATHGLGFDRK